MDSLEGFESPYSPMPGAVFLRPLRKRESKFIVDPFHDSKVPPLCWGLVLCVGDRVKEKEILVPGTWVCFCPAGGTLLPVPEGAEEVLVIKENEAHFNLVWGGEGVPEA